VSQLVITGVTITPVAFHDPPLLNHIGVHEPFALRAVIELHTDSGLTGLGETYGDLAHLERLRGAAEVLIGCDVFALHEIRSRIRDLLNRVAGADRHGLTGQVTQSGTIDRVFAGFEVACLDVQGRALGRPVSDLLGGAVRDHVPFSAYLFYKWAGHPDAGEDDWGPALDPAGLVAQARRMVAEYGFTAIKLKGGVFAPEQEIEAIRALRDAFPTLPLRLDPNAAWGVETSVKVGRTLTGVLEYLEDPTAGIPAMSEVGRRIDLPLATNMCVVDFEALPAGIARRAVDIVLSDHHFWGGLHRTSLLAGICATFGLGLSMHSNSHLGISLAAMTHFGAATPELTYACDTHWPWKRADEEVVIAGSLSFQDGAVAVPKGPGLGVELDRDALARLHEQYVSCGIRARDDTAYMISVDPSYERRTPKW
jgi:glucarate dehydratase